MKNEDYLGIPKTAGDYELSPGGDLSILLINKERFKELMLQHTVPADQAKIIWDWYTGQTNKKYEQHRDFGKGGELSRERLQDLDSSDWLAFAKENGIDVNLADDLFNAYIGEAEQRIEAQEQALAEASQEEETAAVEQPPVSDGVAVYMSKTEARLEREKIMQNPDDPYWGNTGTVAEQAKRLALVTRLREIEGGLTDRLDGYPEQLYAEQEEIMKDVYEVSTLKPGAYNSSNGEMPSKSLDDSDGEVDSPYLEGNKSSAYGNRIEDGGGE